VGAEGSWNAVDGRACIAQLHETDRNQVNTIDTAIPIQPRSSEDETPQSVIHAPQGFKQLVSMGLIVDVVQVCADGFSQLA
jgi:hypothetical protein